MPLKKAILFMLILHVDSSLEGLQSLQMSAAVFPEFLTRSCILADLVNEVNGCSCSVKSRATKASFPHRYLTKWKEFGVSQSRTSKP